MKPHSIKNLIIETNMNLFSWHMIEDGFLFSPSVKRFVGGAFNATVMHVSQDSGQWGVDIKLWNQLGQKVQDKLSNKTLNAEQNLKEHLVQGKILFKLADQVIDHDLGKWTNKQFIAWLKEAWKHYTELNALGFLAVISDFDHNLFSNRLAGILEKHSTSQNPTQKYMATLISPDQPDLNWIELLELLKIVKKYKNLNKIIKSSEFRNHIKKYKWINFGYQGPLWHEEDFTKRIKKVLDSKQSIGKQLDEHENYFKVLKAQQRKIEKDLNLSADEQYMFGQARILMFTKAYRLNVRHAIQYAFELTFAQLGRMHAIPVYFFRYALSSETLAFLSGKKIDTVEVLRRRNRVLKIVENGKRSLSNKIKSTKRLKKS